MRLLTNILPPILKFIGVALILYLAVLWIGIMVSLLLGWSYASFWLPTHALWSYISGINLFVVIAFPILGAIFFVFRLFFNTRVNKTFSNSLTAFWAINLIGLIAMVVFLTKDFKTYTNITTQSHSITAIDQPLTLQLGASPNWDWGFTIDNKLGFEDKNLLTKNIEIKFLPTSEKEIKVEQFAFARGETKAIATARAKQINYPLSIVENTITFPQTIQTNKDDKWRGQEAIVEISLPIGTRFIVQEPNAFAHYVDFDEDHINPGYFFSSDTPIEWQMTEAGLVCTTIEGETTPLSDMIGEITNNQELVIDGDFNVVVDFDNTTSIQIDGEEDAITAKEVNGQISLSLEEGKESDATVYVQLSALTALTLKNGAHVEVRGFDQSAMQINCRDDDSYLKTEMDIDNLTVTQIGDNVIELNGIYLLIDATLQQEAKLSALNANVKDANLTAEDASSIIFNSGISGLKQNIDESSEVVIND